ncbi:MAG: peptide-binding protein [Dehalococcoidia bacterium]|nr:MAG: peptide-binding protein [Dehalococcoidia bacterium]
MLPKKTVFIALIALICLSCAPKKDTSLYDDPGKPAYGDTMITASIGEASSLIPILASDSASHEIAGYVYNGLVKLDKDLNIVGDLAESWDISKDNLTFTFYLRKGVKWHDGRPFTAHDVMYTYQVIIDPKTPTPYSSDFKAVKEVKVIDDYTFRATYDKPFAPSLISWGTSILPKHLLEGTDITKSPLIRRPVGTGPYMFREWISGDRVVLVANDAYFDGKPFIARHVVKVIPDSATMFLELKRNSIDSMSLTPLQFTKQTNYPAFKREFNRFQYLSFTYVYFGFNLKHRFFKDKRVRQALSHAVNKQEIIDGILLGQGIEATGPYKPDMRVYNKNVKRYEYSKEKALALLAEAGFQKNPDGMLAKDGTPFEFTILVNQGNDVRIRCAELIQQRLKDLGISVKIRVVEWASFINEFIDKRNFEVVILGWSISRSDPDLYDVWHSSKQGPKELNFMSFENKEVDDLLIRARHTFNKDERKRYYDRIQEILAEEQPYIFLFIPYANLAIHKRFKGIDPAPAGIGYNIIKWYVPEEQRRYKANAALSP